MDERNYGIDLLRIGAMFMVVILHTLGQGGILGSATALSHQYEIAWFLEIAAYCAVNCYALISGYVGVNTEFKYYKIIVLWLQVVFYTLLITLIFSLIYPKQVTGITWFNAIFPVSTIRYWYFTAYFGMFFFIPFFNKLLNSLSKTGLKCLGITIFVIFSIWQIVWQTELFAPGGSYSLMWLALLYLLGGIIKKLDFTNRFKKWQLLVIYAFCITCTWAFKFVFEKYPIHNINPSLLVNYISPTILFSGFALLMFSIKLNIRNKVIIWLVKFLSPLSFSVYIIHANPLIFNNVLPGKFASYVRYSSVHLVVAVLFSALSIYLICSIIDIVRYYLFKILKVSAFYRNIENKHREDITVKSIV